MQKISGAILVGVTCAVAVFALLFSGFYYHPGGFYAAAAPDTHPTVAEPDAPNDAPASSSAAESMGSASSDPGDASSAASTPQDASLPAPPQNPAVTAASPGQAVGKIVEQFLSPYSAALSAQKVYIKNKTSLQIDLNAELAAPLKIKLTKSAAPEILIVHTHATESYLYESRDFYTADDPTRSTDNTRNMVYIGDVVASRLRAAGFSVLHDTTQHDNPSYTGSYANAEKTIRRYLQQYPSIRIVLDVHRDSISLQGADKARPVTTIGGKRAAQVMLVMGCQDGTVTGFENWRENFRLACRFQQAMETDYPGLARAMTFAAKKYNEHLTTGSMLLEVGTETNTFTEAAYGAQLAADSLGRLLNTLC